MAGAAAAARHGRLRSSICPTLLARLPPRHLRQSDAGRGGNRGKLNAANDRRGSRAASSASTRPGHQSRCRPRRLAGARWEAAQGKPSLAPPRKPAGALGRAGLWLFPRSARPPAEDATPESAAFGDQAPRGAAAWRDSRPDSARSSDAGLRRLPRPKPAPRGACRPSHRDDLAKSRHWSARRLRQSDFGAPRAAARGRRGGSRVSLPSRRLGPRRPGLGRPAVGAGGRLRRVAMRSTGHLVWARRGAPQPPGYPRSGTGGTCRSAHAGRARPSGGRRGGRPAARRAGRLGGRLQATRQRLVASNARPVDPSTPAAHRLPRYASGTWKRRRKSSAARSASASSRVSRPRTASANRQRQRDAAGRATARSSGMTGRKAGVGHASRPRPSVGHPSGGCQPAAIRDRAAAPMPNSLANRSIANDASAAILTRGFRRAVPSAPLTRTPGCAPAPRRPCATSRHAGNRRRAASRRRHAAADNVQVRRRPAPLLGGVAGEERRRLWACRQDRRLGLGPQRALSRVAAKDAEMQLGWRGAGHVTRSGPWGRSAGAWPVPPWRKPAPSPEPNVQSFRLSAALSRWP